MITIETITVGTRQLQRTKSDIYMIMQIETGNIYQEAIDVIPATYTYEETDVLLPTDDITDSEALSIIIGGDGE